jgi:hypothetical protein
MAVPGDSSLESREVIFKGPTVPESGKGVPGRYQIELAVRPLQFASMQVQLPV